MDIAWGREGEEFPCFQIEKAGKWEGPMKRKKSEKQVQEITTEVKIDFRGKSGHSNVSAQKH